jgi:hypothetical protein
MVTGLRITSRTIRCPQDDAGVTQTYALGQLDAIAKKLESTKVGDFGDGGVCGLLVDDGLA